jgi:hypothetical protein
VPIGVASLSDGGAGLWRGGTSALLVAPLTTGRAFGDGGIARPSLGVRVPLALREPGMGGLRRGAGADMVLFRGNSRVPI